MSRHLVRVHLLLRRDQVELLRVRARADGGSVSNALRELLDRNAGTAAIPPRELAVRSAAGRFLEASSPDAAGAPAETS